MASVVIRGFLLAVMLAVLISVAPEASSAVTDLGQFCGHLVGSGFDDTIRGALTQPSGDATFITVNFRWRGYSPVPGFPTPQPFYQIVGTGTITESFVSPGYFDLVLTGSHNSTNAFGGNLICSLRALLLPPSFTTAVANVTCVGSGGEPFFASFLTLNSEICRGED